MSTAAGSVAFVIDEDAGDRQQLELVLRAAGFAVQAFVDEGTFLRAVVPSQAGCLIVSVRAADKGSGNLQDELRRRGYALPVIVLMANAELPAVVATMKGGAFDVIERPFDAETLAEKVQRAFELDGANRARHTELNDVRDRIASLSEGERRVVELLCAGHNNGQIATMLNISRRAVEARRAKLMATMKAGSLAELVKFAILVEQRPGQ